MSRRQPSGSAASAGSGARPPGPPAGGPRRGGHGAAMAPAEKSLNFGASARRLIGLLKPHRLRVIAVLALSVTAVVMNVVAPKVLGKAVDAVFAGSVSMHLPLGSTKAQAVAALRASGQSKMADMVAAMDLVPGAGIDFDRVATILLTVVALYVVASLLQVVQARLLNTVVQRTVEKLRADVDAKLQRVPLAYVDSRPRGELLSRVTNDIDNVGQSMQQSAGQLLVSICTVLGVVVNALGVKVPEVIDQPLTLIGGAGIPLILVAFGLPDAGLRLPYFWCGVLSLVLSSAAFVCENVRSGINTVPVGHTEAARSIGLGFFGTLAHVVLPQAFRSMVQPLVNVFIGTVIGSSLCAAISVVEITYVTQQLNIQSAQAVLLFLVAGAVYLVLSLGGAWIGLQIERAVSPGRRGRRRDTLNVQAGVQA